MTDNLPTYDQLPVVSGNPPKTAWGLFGPDDQIGMFNLQTPERIVQAAQLIRKGKMFPMNWDQTQPNPPLYNRGAVRHKVFRQAGFGHHGDDVLDNLYTQQSSQWDALTHVGDFEHGFWGGVTNEWLIENRDTPKLGIEHWAKRGIAGRAVVLDIGRWYEQQGNPLPMDEYVPDPGRCDRSLPRRAGRRASDRRCRLNSDRLDCLVRTAGHGHTPIASRRCRTSPSPDSAAPREMAAYFFDHHVAALCSDNPALEAWPPPNFADPDGFLHHWIIGRFGMAIGEMFTLEDLAADCAEDGVYETFFAAAPLNVTGGTGSPPNGLAIK